MAETYSRNITFLHARFDGISQDIPLAELDLGPFSSEEEVKSVLAAHLGVSPSKLAPYVVERHVSGNLTVRPEAVFG